MRASTEENPSGHTSGHLHKHQNKILEVTHPTRHLQPGPSPHQTNASLASSLPVGKRRRSLPQLPIRGLTTLSNLSPSCCSFGPFPLALSSVELENGWSLSSGPKPFADWKTVTQSPLLSFLVSRLDSTTSSPASSDNFVRELDSDGVRGRIQARK